MTSTGKDYRGLLVKQVRATGEYIAKNADELVDKLIMKTGFHVEFEIEPMEIPVLRITQEHAMANVIEIIREDNR